MSKIIVFIKIVTAENEPSTKNLNKNKMRFLIIAKDKNGVEKWEWHAIELRRHMSQHKLYIGFFFFFSFFPLIFKLLFS